LHRLQAGKVARYLIYGFACGDLVLKTGEQRLSCQQGFEQWLKNREAEKPVIDPFRMNLDHKANSNGFDEKDELKKQEKTADPKIFVVGVGPGSKELLTLKAISLIERAECVAGFSPALAIVDHLILAQKKIVLDYSNQDLMLSKLVELALQGNICVVCAYGDANVSDKQLIERLQKSNEGVKFALLPGISSVQFACARLKLPLEEALLITFHKRGSIESEKLELRDHARLGKRNVLVFPRPWDFMPSDIAKFLVAVNIEPERKVTVLQKLTLEGETIKSYTLGELAMSKEAFSDLTILVVSSRLP
jgi:precorrin-6y C5,15-methyltransferase (decarboxylating) CbiE subunit